MLFVVDDYLIDGVIFSIVEPTHRVFSRKTESFDDYGTKKPQGNRFILFLLFGEAQVSTDHVSAARIEFERSLLTSNPVPKLRDLGDPFDLHLLFCLELCAIVRWGPSGPISPPRLLSVAQQAARLGTIPVATPISLRNTLKQLETRLHQASAWQPSVPLWWNPLPVPTSLELLWERLQSESHSFSTVLSHSGLSANFAHSPGRHLSGANRSKASHCEANQSQANQSQANQSQANQPQANQPQANQPQANQWISSPSLIAAPLVRALHRELESAYQSGKLHLERGTVGPHGTDSPSRADYAGYFSGTEQALIETLPTTAVAVQWLLHALCPTIQKAIPASDLFAPRNVMIAHYPAPSTGYHRHIDSPSDQHQSGRRYTLVVYLNGPEQECVGGDLALWAPNRSTSEPPTAVFSARSGSAVIFDSRTIPHQVSQLQHGPARWALTLWLHAAPARARTLSAPPELTLRDALLPLESPPLPTGRVLFHELPFREIRFHENDGDPAGVLVVRPAGNDTPRAGLVSTVYRGGPLLDAWCWHHIELGFDHLVLIFDRLEEPQEAAAAARLTAKYSATQLTVWSGAEASRDRWPQICQDPDQHELLRFAHSGSSSHAVAARQTLNAGAALQAAKRDELGGTPLDWAAARRCRRILLPPGKRPGWRDREEPLCGSVGRKSPPASLRKPRVIAADSRGQPAVLQAQSPGGSRAFRPTGLVGNREGSPNGAE